MVDLRALLAGLGYDDVQTLLNSGNASTAAQNPLVALGVDPSRLLVILALAAS